MAPRESTVTLEVIPANATDETVTKSIAIKRDKVKLEEQSASKDVINLDRDGQSYRIGVINIPTFYADFQAMQAGDANYKSTTRDVRNLIDELKEDGVDGVVMDLRNNGGGALHEANDLVGLFIDQGPTVQIRNSNNDVQVLTDEDPAVAYDGPLVVLVNRMSASASEIFCRRHPGLRPRAGGWFANLRQGHRAGSTPAQSRPAENHPIQVLPGIRRLHPAQGGDSRYRDSVPG